VISAMLVGDDEKKIGSFTHIAVARTLDLRRSLYSAPNSMLLD
jgi:hypothetical protein